MAQINFSIDEELKKEWEDEVESSPDYSSVSHLIRLSVNKEIRGASPDLIREIKTDIDTSEIENKIDELKVHIYRAKQGNYQNSKKHVEEILEKINDMVPTVKNEQFLDDYVEKFANHEDDDLRIEMTGHIGAIIDKLDHERKFIIDAIHLGVEREDFYRKKGIHLVRFSDPILDENNHHQQWFNQAFGGDDE